MRFLNQLKKADGSRFLNGFIVQSIDGFIDPLFYFSSRYRRHLHLIFLEDDALAYF